MSTLPDIPPEMQPLEPVQTGHGAASLWYGILLAAAPFVALVGFIALSGTDWFLRHNGYPLLRYTLGYSLRARNMNCEVLIYGDSASLTGLDPSIIEKRTGLKTCNISELRPVHWIVGSYFPLDQYLAHNARPKFLLTMWTPSEFHPEPVPMPDFESEGFVYALHFHPGMYVVKALVRHPTWAVNLGTWAENRVQSGLIDTLRRRDTLNPPGYVAREARAGFWHYPLPPETRCARSPYSTDHFTPQQGAEAISEFRKRYAVGGTRVIFDASAWAECAPDREKVIRDSMGQMDNQLEFLPIENFNELDIHFSEAGSKHVSEEAADQVLGMMRTEK